MGIEPALPELLRSHAGECAALATAFCWTASALCFTAAGRRVGSLPVNLIRLVIAWLLFAACGLVVNGVPVPLHAPAQAWGWLLLSGLTGFFVGDLCLFRAFVLIGPRLSMLVMSFAPPLTALLGGIALGERLSLLDWTGMAITLAGVVWVVTERRPATGAGTGSTPPSPTPTPTPSGADSGNRGTGLLLAFGGAVGQAGGLVLGKAGLAHFPHPFDATQIRVTAALAAFAVLFAAARLYPRVGAALRDRRALLLMSGGAAIGPFLGTALIMTAVTHVSTGLAQTFVALTPVLIIPLSVRLHGDRVGPRAILGALVAFAGVALLFAD